jgi:hypothetical protein
MRGLMSRRNALKLLLAGGAGSVGNAFWIEPARLSITREDIRIPRLPAGLDGLKVGLLADLHYKPDQDAPLLAEAVAALNREQPDLIALPGDFIDHDPRVIDPMMEILSKLSARHGVFASMGNHDGWAEAANRLRRGFERAGMPFLVNRHTRLTIGGESLAVAATDHVWQGNPDPAKTLAGIPSSTPVIALVHEPDFFDEMTARRNIQLQLSGHTHGGQCRVPVLGYAPAKVAYGRKYIQGAFERGDSRLFVTRGLGTTGLRVRFACPPEVAVLTLRCAPTV